MALLTRENILNADDIAHRDVEVKEWGGTVRVRSMSGAERDAFEQSILDAKGKAKNIKNIRARFVASLIVDEKGDRVFADSDIEALGKKNGKALDHLFDVAQKLSGMAEDDLEELAGNS